MLTADVPDEAKFRLVLLAVVSDRIFDEISIALSEASPNLSHEIAELLDVIIHLSCSYRDASISVEELASGVASIVSAPEKYKDTFDPKTLERRLLGLLSIQSLTLCNDDFLAAKTIEQIIAEQGVSPIADVSIFSGVIPDEDIDEFVADIYRGRAA
jgi:hypothetical protein